MEYIWDMLYDKKMLDSKHIYYINYYNINALYPTNYNYIFLMLFSKKFTILVPQYPCLISSQ